VTGNPVEDKEEKQPYTLSGYVSYATIMEISWRFIKKLKIDLHCGLAVPLLGI
jgi:hypothetical protein